MALPRGTRIWCLALGLVLACCLSGPEIAAQTLLPQDITARLDAAARSLQSSIESQARVSRGFARAGIAPALDADADAYAAEVLSAAALGEIVARPDLAGSILAAVAAHAPQVRSTIEIRVRQAFPGLFVSPGSTDSAAPSTRSASGIAAATRTTVEEPTRDDVGVNHEPIPPLGDPWEGFNRGIFAFNDVVDRFLLAPVARGYSWLKPDPVEIRVANAFHNLLAPVRLANDLLQLEFRDAGVTASRFIANSTMGIGGLFDVATNMGLPDHPADFGQTLHAYGAGSGPYLVLPLFGPSTVRDGVGLAVDVFLHPFTYVLGTPVNLSILGGRTVVRRAELLDPLDDLRESSVDYYAALRSAYEQDRAVELRRGASGTRVRTH